MSKPVIVLDNGSGYLKAGLSCQVTGTDSSGNPIVSPSSEPDITIPSLIGRPMLRFAESIENIHLKPIMIGDEVTPVRSLLELSYPIKEGIIEDKEEMNLVLDYAINKKIGVDKSDYKDRKVMITEAPSNPTDNKIRMGEILLEKMGIGAFNIEPQAKLTLYCEGLQTGMVLDSGDGVSHCIPVTEGLILHNNIKRLNIAGRHITTYLTRLLQTRGYAFNSTADFEIVRDLKEKYCFVSCDIQSDRRLNLETSYYNSRVELPDKRVINIANEKYEAPEILFQPFLCQSEQPGIHEMVYDSINTCPIDTRKSLYKNILLSGATTMFPGFASRIDLEIRKLYIEKNLKESADRKIKIDIDIIDSPRRKFSVFIGACVLSEVLKEDPNGQYWITKEEWDEAGAENIIFKKCQNIVL